MVTTSQVVQDLLKRQVLIREAMNQGIVSFNKLAIVMRPQIEAELGKKVKHSAVVMALRRNSEKLQKSSKEPSFSYSIETIKTDICYILLEESSNLLHKLKDFYSKINFKKGGILNIIQGNFEVAIITNKKYKEDLLDILYDEKVIVTIDDLIAISLIYSKDFLFTPGVIYDVSRFLTWENINVIDIILTKTEMSIIISNQDFMKAYRLLGRFAENKNNSKKILESTNL